MKEKKLTAIKVEWLESICEARKLQDYDRVKYMVGVELVDGRKCAFHTVNYIDCDIATGDLIGWNETADGEIEVVLVPRKMVLYRA